MTTLTFPGGPQLAAKTNVASMDVTIRIVISLPHSFLPDPRTAAQYNIVALGRLRDAGRLGAKTRTKAELEKTSESAPHQYAGRERHGNPRKLADIIGLSGDLLTIDPGKILDDQVLMTLVNGKVVYERS